MPNYVKYFNNHLEVELRTSSVDGHVVEQFICFGMDSDDAPRDQAKNFTDNIIVELHISSCRGVVIRPLVIWIGALSWK